LYKKINKIHLIGIGGIGMSGIAELLLRHGYQVSGSDLAAGDTVRMLEKRGVRICIGHRAENVLGTDLVVHSSAVREENPELVSAREQRILTIPRAEMLAELMRLKTGIAVAGAHGKTTTTSMIALALVEGGLDPTVVVGGRMDNFGGTNARLGGGEYMVVEADESDGSFNKLSPSIGIVTNMDREHMDYYKSMRRLKTAFVSFLNKVPFYGLSVICTDDPYLRTLQHRVTRRKRTYGFGKDADYRFTEYLPSEAGSTCKLTFQGTTETLRLQVPGKHNALNALAALIVSDELGVARADSLRGLASYQGVQRRFQKRGLRDGVQFIDDYAHHPSEISATLAAARERYPKSKIRVIFQPHRYSRVEDLFDQFVSCFNSCDAVAITDIYSAGETPIPGIDSEGLVENLRRQGHRRAEHVQLPLQGVETWLSESVPGDVILTLGAGDLPNVYKQLF